MAAADLPALADPPQPAVLQGGGFSIAPISTTGGPFCLTADNHSHWVYESEELGQVVPGRRYWNDGTPVAGQQYTYAYDDIGNRRSSGAGGTDDPREPLRTTGYTVNLLNQVTGRTNPSAADVLGVANAAADV